MDTAATNLYDFPLTVISRPVGAQAQWSCPFTYELPAPKVIPAESDVSASYSTLDPRYPLSEHWDKLRSIQKDPSLWPEDSEAPSEYAIGLAGIALRSLDRLGFPPSRVVASSEGGVGVCFVKGDKYADIEFLNTGEILGVISNRRDRPVVWEVGADEYSVSEAVRRIREFIQRS